MNTNRYYRRDLERMTTYQLREIARREKIIPALVNPLDKELLIHTILLYRGADTSLLIEQYREDDYKRLEEAVQDVTFLPLDDVDLTINSRITVWRGLATDFFDNLTLPYLPDLNGVNAFIIDNYNNLCAVFNVLSHNSKNLFLRRPRNLPCSEAATKDYTLVILPRKYSEEFFHFYNRDINFVKNNVPAYCIKLLDFKVLEPEPSKLPAAIDFGTTNTVAALLNFSKPAANSLSPAGTNITYAIFTDSDHLTYLIPSLIAVDSLADPDNPALAFGYDALNLSAYLDDGRSVFYDIKRWVVDYNRLEELVDSEGRRVFLPRSSLLRSFFLHLIQRLEDSSKVKVAQVLITCPVKQRRLFHQLFTDILPDYTVNLTEMLDEGAAVLYNTINELIVSRSYQNGRKSNALVIDCGGGTTDVSSCTFRINDKRVAFNIDLETRYVNGSTDFGGNNLTYRILQILKLRIIEALYNQYLENQTRSISRARREFYGIKDIFDKYDAGIAATIPSLRQLIKDFSFDIFRFIDERGTEVVYKDFNAAYDKAEQILPTRFKEWESRSRTEYFKVKCNYYYLFQMADKIKQAFFERKGTMKVLLTANEATPSNEEITNIEIDKWRLTIQNGNGLNVVTELPDILFSILEIEPIINPDIYGIVKALLDPLYNSGELDEYNIIKLSGQSCKIELFRTALKEFVPGKIIKSRPRADSLSTDLKFGCVDGALKFLRDKKFGYADINIKTRAPILPYTLTGFTHTGEKVMLVSGAKSKSNGVISRSIEDLTLTLYTSDNEGKFRQEVIYNCTLDEFTSKTQEEIESIYGENIPQDETDTIVNREVKFFIWSEPQDWGFMVVPVYREDEQLYIGREQFFSFEDEHWLLNFFDGLK